MSDPSTVNHAAETFDTIASGAVMKILVPVAEKAEEAAVPELNLPVVKQIFEFGVEEIAAALLNASVALGVKIIITIQTDIEKSTYGAAEGKLRAALLSKDPLAIAKAKAEFENAADSVIHYDGSFTPDH